MPPDHGYWLRLYEQVCREGVSLAGHYNRNYRAGSQVGEVLIRVPIADAPVMDVAGFDEVAMMQAAAQAQMPVPQVIHHSRDPAFQVHSFIAGRTLERVRVQQELDAQAVGQMARLLGWAWRAPTGQLAAPDGWPDDGDVHAFWALLVGHARRVHERTVGRFAGLLAALGVPDDPFGVFDQVGRGLTGRPFTLGHCDLHPGNVLVGSDGRFWAIDWQLGLVCDPAFDVTCHLTRVGYTAEQERWFWHALVQIDPQAGQRSFVEDVQRHRHLEAAKSVMVDVERAWQDVQQAGSYGERERAVRSLWQSLQWTAVTWRHQRWTAGQLVGMLEQFSPA